MRVWLIGAKGMLGQAVADALDEARLDYRGTDLEVDITDEEAVLAEMARVAPGWIVNCAAYTAVDQAEDEQERAYELNGRGPAILAGAAATAGAALLHLSTDYVFDGTLDRPYRESDPPNPQSAYGRSKLAGEEAVRTNLAQHVILRTAWLYGHGGGNFVETMLRLMSEREELSVVDDQLGTPTNASELAGIIVTILQAPEAAYGTYHVSGSGQCSWYEFAVEIQRQATELGTLSGSCSIRPVTSDEFPQKAKRPANSRLSKEKITADYGVVPAAWQESLAGYLRERNKR